MKNKKKLHITFVDINKEVVDAWWAHLSGILCVDIRQGSIFEEPVDAIVSPANSFGWMDGGIDLAISQMLGWHIQERLQTLIHEKYSHFEERPDHGGWPDGSMHPCIASKAVKVVDGLPVGKAEIIPTGKDQIPFVICSPTMRTPGPVIGSNNAYLAMRAVLEAVDGRDDICSIAVPGLCTLTGRMDYEESARQIHRALMEYFEAQGS